MFSRNLDYWEYLCRISAYNANPAVRFSELKNMRDSALEYQYRLNTPSKETPAMIRGGALNDAVFVPQYFDRMYCKKSSAAQKHYIMQDHDYYDVLRARDRILDHLLGLEGDVEVPVYWTDKETGIRLKSRIDLLTHGGFYELKFVSRVYMQPYKFGYHYLDMQWDVQNALYHDGLEARGYVADPVIQLVIQQTAPYDIIEYEVPHYIIEDGRSKYYKFLRQLKESRDSGQWPGRANNERLTLIVPQRYDYTEDGGFELDDVGKG